MLTTSTNENIDKLKDTPQRNSAGQTFHTLLVTIKLQAKHHTQPK